MSEWKEYLLEDAIEKFIDYRGKTPKKVNSGIPLITAKVIKDGYILTPNEFIEEDEYDSWMTRGLPKINDVLLTTEAPLGEVALIKDENIALAQRIILLRGKQDVLDNSFLFYSLRSRLMQHRLASRASGSTVQGIKSSELKQVLIPLPNLEEQRAIAAVLSCLDGKIENLRRQNETLEAIAQTLFKHWFIDFEFPNSDGKPYKSSGGTMEPSELGDIPVGWRVGTLGEITRVINGRAYKQTEFREEGTPIVRIQNLTGKGQTVYSDLELNEDKHINKGDLIYAWSATFGAYIWRGLKSIYHYHIWKLNCFNPTFKYYAYLHLKRVSDRVKGQGTGSIFTHITKALMETQDLYIPDDLLMSKWHSLSSSMFDKIMSNHEQIQTLTKTRDTLLPKLMSGKLRVKS